MKFTDFNLPEQLQQSLADIGFTDLTPVQEATYPVISAGRDLCALAETGSGKTAACAIPLAEKIDTADISLQALVVVPTRELCMQYVEEIGRIANQMPIISFAAFGGFDKDIQASKLKSGVHILVTTPGRFIDHLYDGTISLAKVKTVILDEADQLLDEGFLDDIKLILSCIRHEHQTLLFSATMPEAIKTLVAEHLRDPEFITLTSEQKAPASLDHWFMGCAPDRREHELLKYLRSEQVGQAIIFCNSRDQVDKLHNRLKKELRDTEFIHAGIPQNKRTSIFRQFKNQKLRYMIATDVAGRGLDFSGVTHVINWDFPRDDEQYTHRTGRAGRMGREGKALTFIGRRDVPRLKHLVRIKGINPFWIGEDPLTGQPGQHPLTGGGKTPRSGKPDHRREHTGHKSGAPITGINDQLMPQEPKRPGGQHQGSGHPRHSGSRPQKRQGPRPENSDDRRGQQSSGQQQGRPDNRQQNRPENSNRNQSGNRSGNRFENNRKPEERRSSGRPEERNPGQDNNRNRGPKRDERSGNQPRNRQPDNRNRPDNREAGYRQKNHGRREEPQKPVKKPTLMDKIAGLFRKKP